MLAEFEWKSRTDKITGETHWFMSPIKSAVQTLINEVPSILNAGIDLLEKDDHALARQLAKDLTNLIETTLARDSYQETALKRHFNNQLARKAIYALRTVRAADEWSTRVQCQGNEEPDNLTAMIERAFDDAKQVATLRSVLLQIDPKMEVNYKSAAWDVMKYLAFSNQKKYLNPDELSNRQANTHSATDTLVSRHHCRIEVDGEGAWLVDLGSSNGTSVNGERASRRIVEEGDRIQVGKVRVHVDALELVQ